MDRPATGSGSNKIGSNTPTVIYYIILYMRVCVDKHINVSPTEQLTTGDRTTHAVTSLNSTSWHDLHFFRFILPPTSIYYAYRIKSSSELSHSFYNKHMHINDV